MKKKLKKEKREGEIWTGRTKKETVKGIWKRGKGRRERGKYGIKKKRMKGRECE